jgi:hypothetical protein
MSRKKVNSYLRTSSGVLLQWDSKDKNGRTRTELEIINSATKASQLIQSEFRKTFWTYVLERNHELLILQQN